MDHGLDEDRSFISVVSIAEIRRGAALMDKGRKRDALAGWLARDLPQRFEPRVLPVENWLSWPGRPDGPREAAWPRSVIDGRADCSHRDFLTHHMAGIFMR